MKNLIRHILFDRFGDYRLGWMIFAPLMAVLGVMSVTYILLVPYVYNFDKDKCDRLGEVTERPTKMVGSKYNHDCFVFQNGKWRLAENQSQIEK